MTSHAQSFADALQSLETTRDVDRFVTASFADDVVLRRPETGQSEHGRDGATRYWRQYLDRFQEIRSEFGRIAEGGPGVLEWTGAGRLSSGAAITYTGVSLLDFDDDGRVVGFATYYDTAPFLAGPA